MKPIFYESPCRFCNIGKNSPQFVLHVLNPKEKTIQCKNCGATFRLVPDEDNPLEHSLEVIDRGRIGNKEE